MRPLFAQTTRNKIWVLIMEKVRGEGGSRGDPVVVVVVLVLVIAGEGIVLTRALMGVAVVSSIGKVVMW